MAAVQELETHFVVAPGVRTVVALGRHTMTVGPLPVAVSGTLRIHPPKPTDS